MKRGAAVQVRCGRRRVFGYACGGTVASAFGSGAGEFFDGGNLVVGNVNRAIGIREVVMDLVTCGGKCVGIGDVVTNAGCGDDCEMAEVVAVNKLQDFCFHVGVPFQFSTGL